MGNNKAFESRHDRWAVDYKEYLDSGLTQSEYCEEKGISINTFRYRVSHLKKEASERSAQLFLQIEGLEREDNGEAIVLEKNGRRIIIGSQVPSDRLHVILNAFLDAE